MRTLSASFVLLLAAACGGSSSSGAAPATPSSDATAVFAQAAPYVASGPAQSAAAAHTAKGAPAPGGTACLGCHKSGGSGPSFAFAGTVYVDDKRTAPNPGAEIGVVDAKGTERVAHADADGNFWVAGEPIAVPAHAAARQQAKVVRMGSTVDKADCNGCHDASFPIGLTPPK